MAKNINLHSAKKAKNDEFYTRLTDIEKELLHYKEFFKGKVVYCNCDDARESNFFRYFSLNFEHLGLKKLITTGYNENGKGVVCTYEGDKNGNYKVDDNEIIVKELDGNGDFRSEECVEYLKEADVVVTNPPFSYFRSYIAQLFEYRKKFLIIGNMNAITYKEVFPYIMNNELWCGYNFNKTMEFAIPDDYEKWDRIENGTKIGKVPAITWFTNIPHKKRYEEMDFYKRYNPTDYPTYDNYNAIEVSKTCEIPIDDYIDIEIDAADFDSWKKTYGNDVEIIEEIGDTDSKIRVKKPIMGVPISFLDKYNPSQFEIVDARDFTKYPKLKEKTTALIKDKDSAINGKPTYARIAIRKK